MELLNYIAGFSSGHVAVLIVFLLLVLCGLGLPFPEEILLIAAGYLVYQEMTSLSVAIVACFAGVLIGDLILFSIGNRLGLKVFEYGWFKRMIDRRRLRLSRTYFAKRGKRVVFFGRFVAGLRAPIFLSAAILRMPLLRFLMVDAAAALLSVPLSVWLGYHFGEDIEKFAKLLRDAKFVFMGLIVLGVLIFFGVRTWRRRRKNPKNAANDTDSTVLSE
jgi:membrane protein DedA with SNARE-associated domain